MSHVYIVRGRSLHRALEYSIGQSSDNTMNELFGSFLNYLGKAHMRELHVNLELGRKKPPGHCSRLASWNGDCARSLRAVNLDLAYLPRKRGRGTQPHRTATARHPERISTLFVRYQLSHAEIASFRQKISSCESRFDWA